MLYHEILRIYPSHLIIKREEGKGGGSVFGGSLKNMENMVIDWPAKLNDRAFESLRASNTVWKTFPA